MYEAVYMTGYLPDEEVLRWLAAADIGALPFNHGLSLKSGSLLTCLHMACPSWQCVTAHLNCCCCAPTERTPPTTWSGGAGRCSRTWR